MEASKSWSFNQVVASNLKLIREAKGLTQEAACEATRGFLPGGGWTPAVWSSAERSVAGRRIRKFDADEIAGLASGLGVPLVALFLPPVEGRDQIEEVIGENAHRGLSPIDVLTLGIAVDSETRERIQQVAASLESDLDMRQEPLASSTVAQQLVEVAVSHMRAALDSLSQLIDPTVTEGD